MAKILIVCIHYPVASGRYIARALDRLGHHVKSTGPGTGRAIWGLSVDEKWIWKPDEVERFAPDLILTADSAYSLPETPAGIPHVVYGVDNHVRDYSMRTFDHYFMAHSWGACLDKPNSTWLPVCYDPQAHTCLNDFDQRPIDVGFIGFPYPERVAIIDRLRTGGLSVQASLGWLWDDYNNAMNRCKIALVKSLKGDLAQRFFENMAQGCCVLADKVIDADNLRFQPGVDYWPYVDTEGALMEARYLLETGVWRQIAANGHAKVAPHTWDARCRIILDQMGIA